MKIQEFHKILAKKNYISTKMFNNWIFDNHEYTHEINFKKIKKKQFFNNLLYKVKKIRYNTATRKII
jgi:hypothetical protein